MNSPLARETPEQEGEKRQYALSIYEQQFDLFPQFREDARDG